MAESDTDLFNSLDVKHPDYDEWAEEWERYRDVAGDILVDKEKYLPQANFEPDAHYNFRLEMSQFIPETPLAVERILGALYRQQPLRDLKPHEAELKDFVERTTRKGESWRQVAENIAHKLLTYGVTRILINVPPSMLPGTLTRKEEKDLMVRPFLTNYSPLSITDWEYDEDDVLSFVRIKESRRVRDPIDSEKPNKEQVKFIEFTKSEAKWWIFQETKSGTKEKWQLVDTENQSTGLGMVPMVIESIREIKPAVGSSFIRYASRADVQKQQSESDLAFDSYLHAHPFLKVWTDESLKDLGLGSSTFLKLKPGDNAQQKEDAAYVEIPVSAFTSLQEIIDAKRAQIFRQAQIDPMGIIASSGQTGAFQASGVSRAWSFSASEARILSKLADRMEAIEKAVFDLVLRWQSPAENSPDEPLFEGKVQYPEEFDLASTAQLIEERSQIGALVNSPTLLRTLDKRIASSKIGEATPEDLEKIHSEIDSNPLLGTMAGLSRQAFQMPEMNSDDEPDDNNRSGDRGNRPRRDRNPTGGRTRNS